MWDGANKKRLCALRKYPTSISSLSFNSTGELLAIASSYTYEEGDKPFVSFVERMLRLASPLILFAVSFCSPGTLPMPSSCASCRQTSISPSLSRHHDPIRFHPSMCAHHAHNMHQSNEMRMQGDVVGLDGDESWAVASPQIAIFP